LFFINKSINKSTKKPTFYIDIKSELLRDILRVIFQNMRIISLIKNMPLV
ncbi:hypothetical protein K469DRAFT_584373, partial [Zopfia rhizophila CBS 207.26]